VITCITLINHNYIAEMFVLSQGRFAPITHIVHIADTHIRTGDRVIARVDEYKHVFENLIKDIEKIDAVKNGTAVMVIAGDVFHHKGRLETEGAVVVYEWLNKLLNILPVLVICGNHDFRQEDPGYKDMIEMLVAPYSNSAHKYPIHYLKETGHYLWENIGFGVTSVRDTLRAYNTCGMLTELPTYPDPDLFKNVDCRVAIFHGSISQSAMPNGNQISEYSHGYPLEWFYGYHIAVFGDNHTQQIHKGLEDSIVWGYPGSLVQQDGGEPLLGHGYILWDIVKRTGTLNHVHNDYGTVNILLSKDDSVMVRMRPRETIPIAKALKIKAFPKNPQIRVVGVLGDEVIVENILKQLGVKPSRIYLSKCFTTSASNTYNASDVIIEDEENTLKDTNNKSSMDDPTNKYIIQLADLNSPTKWKSFIQQNAPDLGEDVIAWLFTPNSLVIKNEGIPDALIDKIANRNKSIQQLVDNYEEKINGVYQQRHSIVLKHMEWEYIMCYGANNWFDFSQMDGRVALLNGKNASGKSSFIDVLCLAIFGDATTMRSDITGNKMSVKVIHDKKPTSSKHDSAHIKLLFHINDELYEIKRSFTMKQKDEILQSKVNKIATIHRVEDNALVLVAEGTNMVNDWVIKHFGSLPEILMSTILCQTDGSNFFMQKEEDQIRIIERALHMDTIHAYECILQEALKGHKYILNELTTYMKGITDGAKTSDVLLEEDALKEATDNLNKMKKEYTQVEKKRIKITKLANDLLVRIRNGVDSCGYKLTEAEKELEKEQKKVDSYPDLTPEILEKGHTTKERLNLQIKELESIPKANYNREKATEEIYKIDKLIKNHMKKKPEDEPTITYGYIEEKEHQYNAWLNTIRFMELDLDGLEERITTLKKEQQRLYKEQEILRDDTQNRPTRLKRDYEKWKKEWDDWCSFTSSLTEMTVEELEQRLQAIYDYIKKIDNIRTEFTTITDRISVLSKEKEGYNDIEFNSDCSACMKNPLHKRLELITKELKGQESKKKKLNKKIVEINITEKEYRTEIKEIKAVKPDRNLYETKVSMMNREKAEWDSSIDLWKIEEKLEENKKKIHRDLKTIFDEINILQKIKVEYDVWVKENQHIEDEKGLLDICKEWNDKAKSLADEKSLYENVIKWDDYQKELESNRILFERISQYEKAVNERDKLQDIVLSIQWSNKYEELTKLSAEYSRLQKEIVLLEAKTQGVLERTGLIKKCQQALSYIQHRMSMLQKLVAVFVGDKGFKSWVYNTEIAPLIQNEVNAFLAPLEDFKFVIQYHNGAMLYSLNDRGNNPTLDHASGYQRFIIGIAMRIALSRIGAVGQNVKHLFIDEGFVACDSTNLQKVESILQSMMEMGGYSSVLLMSHLDAIREIAHTRIDIQRSEDNFFSKITWGKNYPVFQKNKKAEMDISAPVVKRNRMKKIS